MALIYPIDFIQDVIYTSLSTMVEDVTTGVLKYPLFTRANLVIGNQPYTTPNKNISGGADVNPFEIRVLQGVENPINLYSRTIDSGLIDPDPNKIEVTTEVTEVSFTIVALSRIPNLRELSTTSIFTDPTSEIYKRHSGRNVIRDARHSLVTQASEEVFCDAGILLRRNSITNIRNLSGLESEAGQITERFEFDFLVNWTYETQRYVYSTQVIDTPTKIVQDN
jgi:hypothetical protein